MVMLTLLTLSILTATPSLYSAALQAREEVYDNGLYYHKDQFGNIHIARPSLDPETFAERLVSFVALCKEERSGSAFMLSIPHEMGSYIPGIKRAGFTLWHADDDAGEWIIENGTPMPAPYSATRGARIILLAQEEGRLFVAGIKDRYKPSFMFPGGAVDRGELPITASVREAFEEVGIRVGRDCAQLAAILFRTNANRYKADDVCNYYTATVEKQAFTIDPREVERAFWAPLEELMARGEHEGLKTSQVTKEILQHIVDQKAGRSRSRTLFLPDFRQVGKAYPDSADVMELQLIG